MTKDYVSWHGNISKADSHCETDYIMYYGGKRHTGFHLPYIRNQKAFFEDKKIIMAQLSRQKFNIFIMN